MACRSSDGSYNSTNSSLACHSRLSTMLLTLYTFLECTDMADHIMAEVHIIGNGGCIFLICTILLRVLCIYKEYKKKLHCETGHSKSSTLGA